MQTVAFSQPFTKAHAEFENGKVLNINKPEGWTSFDVVKKIRSTIRVKKVGHAGTLDPFATGVLLVCTGRATKQVEDLMQLEKEYVAELELGKTTDSFDRTGKILSETEVGQLAETEIQGVCAQFEGETLQTPPMYSALKINGQRLYELARKGITVERRPRKINIYRLDVLNMEIPSVTLRVVCSRGTYVRALAHDIGERLGCGAYLKALVRSRIGSYRLADAMTIEEFTTYYRQR
ncbi:tRNA pseudouridine(55) synthase TruB [candidate division KSB1 bacterium]|nr:tRNA pseudouridine(55) synthase TruB [candidate division KSB1 bacterium]